MKPSPIHDGMRLLTRSVFIFLGTSFLGHVFSSDVPSASQACPDVEDLTALVQISKSVKVGRRGSSAGGKGKTKGAGQEDSQHKLDPKLFHELDDTFRSWTSPKGKALSDTDFGKIFGEQSKTPDTKEGDQQGADKKAEGDKKTVEKKRAQESEKKGAEAGEKKQSASERKEREEGEPGLDPLLMKESEKKGAEAGEKKQSASERKEREEGEPGLDPLLMKETANLQSKFILLDPHLAIAVSLLFAISFQMALVYLINWNSKHIRFYSWLLISTTISIFVAVLMFQAVNTVLEKTVLNDASNWCKAAMNLGQMLLYYTFMQVSTAISSGSFHICLFDAHPFQVDLTYWMDGKENGLTIEDQKDKFKRQTRCWTLLSAHATGFAAINCGGSIQHALPVNQPLLSYVVAAASFIGLVLLFWWNRTIRLYYLNQVKSEQMSLPEHLSRAERSSANSQAAAHPSKMFQKGAADEAAAMVDGKAWSLHLWDEECYDGEEDAAGVCVSFLIVQALRLNIHGRLPDNFGVEEEDYIHPFSCTIKLLFTSLVFLAGLVFIVLQKRHLSASGRLAKRICTVTQSTMAMAFAWCLLYASQYEEAKMLTAEAPWTITERLILAVILSFASFAIILLLDSLGQGNNPQSKEIFYSIIMSLSLLVGFSWEQCFDRAVEVVAEAEGHPIAITLGLALSVAVVVIIPWRKHILGVLIALEEDIETAEQEEGAKASR